MFTMKFFVFLIFFCLFSSFVLSSEPDPTTKVFSSSSYTTRLSVPNGIVKISSIKAEINFEEKGLTHFDKSSLRVFNSEKNLGPRYPYTKTVILSFPLFLWNIKGAYKTFGRICFNAYYNLLDEVGGINKNAYERSSKTYGFLTLPEGEKLCPAVVLLHGSEGFDTTYLDYAHSLALRGIASFFFNRFFGCESEGKSIMETLRNQLVLPIEQEIISTFSAVHLLRSHPHIDKNNIGFIGWSRGGTVAMECTLEENIEAIYPGFQPAALVGYYAMPLIIKQKGNLRAPSLFLHGKDDDFTPFREIYGYLERFDPEVKKTTKKKDGNQEIYFGRGQFHEKRLLLYSKTGHAFDAYLFKKFSWGSLKSLFIPSTRCPDYQNLQDCIVEESEDRRRFIDLCTKKIYPWEKFPEFLEKHSRRGATYKINTSAALQAWQEVRLFLDKQFYKNKMRIEVDKFLRQNLFEFKKLRELIFEYASLKA